MAQRDYVSRGRAGARRKAPGRKKKSSSPGISKTMVALAVAVLVTFVGGLYFITHNKSEEEAPLLPAHTAHPGNGLPPKPEERWRYIKELENRQIGVQSPTEPTAGGEVKSQTELTPEQRQLLEQMQADMRQQPTQLSEVPYNDPAQSTHTTSTSRMPVTNSLPRQQPVQPQPPKAVPRAQTQAQQPAPVTAVQPKAEKPKEKEKEKAQRWMVQCGSFRTGDQAESVRAQLAFEGIESRITANGGWNRVVLGPYSTRAAADKSLQRLRGVGMSGCIPLAAGG
ncbi:MAG: cell division protein FtsN [Yersiniaceae bacterium]|uniref:Cell division protein FtsN n=1 Tax=Chimaeribacter coloradensis TaxID=2060068 RepID=A0A2N5DVS9_9GAMM|nr:cell division protein FtsN [Chimaeribacter coloradensis]MDU6409475.1 cell division protein FtsN [Yersiniaceae bacterium]PLR31171.1 cell division protein FtsN [Chimaeribacter coloradensis]